MTTKGGPAQSVSDSYVMDNFTYWVGMPFRAVLRTMQWCQKGAGMGNLNGVNAPVDTERFTTELETEGTIPEELNGLFIRTGPNVQHPPAGGYHLFDGDAMVHAVYFSDGKARSYQNHWLRTPKFLWERAFGAPLRTKIGDARGVLGLLIIIWEQLFGWLMYPRRPGEGARHKGPLGNTALVFHQSKLLATMEAGFPFLLSFCKGLLASVGAYTFGGQLKRAMTAHPKRHPVTGDLHAFHYKPDGGRKDWCNYYVCAADGAVSRTVNIDVSRPQMMHDFCITRRYAIFLDNALVFDIGHVAKGGSIPFVSDTKNPCRIGVVRKPGDVGDNDESTNAQNGRNGAVTGKAAAGGEVQWFEVPPFVCMHTINAWEVDDDTICVAFCQGDSLSLDSAKAGDYYKNGPYAFRYTLHLASGTVDKECLTPVARQYRCEFPVVAGAAYGHKQRHAYAVSYQDEVAGDGGIDDFDGIVKLDVTAAAGQGWVASLKVPGYTIGEPFYVPRDADALRAGVAADPHFVADNNDGWLLAWTIHKKSGKCQCMIFDAQTMSSTPVATVTIPVRVPTGFHCLFVPQAELDTQDAKLKAPAWDSVKPGKSANVGGSESLDEAAYRRRVLTGSAQ